MDPRLLEDTWGRAVLVLDEHTTPGRMLLSASGPLAENYGGGSPGIEQFWQRALEYLASGAWIVQRNAAGEAIPWQLQQGAGTLLVCTKDPIVEHGVQQIRHLDHYNDTLTHWLCKERPAGPLRSNGAGMQCAIPPRPPCRLQRKRRQACKLQRTAVP